MQRVATVAEFFWSLMVHQTSNAKVTEIFPGLTPLWDSDERRSIVARRSPVSRELGRFRVTRTPAYA
jgi:hypothetical protein